MPDDQVDQLLVRQVRDTAAQCRANVVNNVSVTGSRVWNSLTPQLSDSELTVFEFRRLPKAYFFCWRPRRLLIAALRRRYKCTYLLTYLRTGSLWHILNTSKGLRVGLQFPLRHVNTVTANPNLIQYSWCDSCSRSTGSVDASMAKVIKVSGGGGVEPQMVRVPLAEFMQTDEIDWG